MKQDKKLIIKNKKRNKFAKILPYLLLMPVLMLLILFIVLPALRTVYMSFFKVTYGLENQYVGFDNFINAFNNSTVKNAFFHTFLFSITVVIGQIGLGLVAAILMSTGFKLQKLFISIILMPYSISIVVAIIIWKYMLDPDFGIINYLLGTIMGIGQIEWASNPNQAWIVIILISIWLQFPFSFLIMYSSIISIPKDIYESAYIAGASNWDAIRYIIIPLIKPSIMVATIFAFILAFREFTTVWLLTGGGPVHRTELISTLLYKEAFSYWNFGSASAIALIMTIATLITALPYLKIMYRRMFVK